MSEIIDDIEEEVLSLVGQIEYGDISDLPTYWKSLMDSLRKLEWLNGLNYINSVSQLLKKLPAGLYDPSLADVSEQMEELTAESSSDTIEEEALSDLRELAVEFEKKFNSLIERLKDVISE